MERMFVIYGNQNYGKTHTAWMVLNHLLEYGAELLWFKDGVHQYTLEEILSHPESISDYRALLLFNGKKIAAWSNGDYLEDFQYDMKWAIEQGADYVICTARSLNRKGSVYHELMTKYKGIVLDDEDWFWVEKIHEKNWLSEKDNLAKQIARRVCFGEESKNSL